MRSRWHKWWVSALLVSACGLNPHPDIPAIPAEGPGPILEQPGGSQGGAGSVDSHAGGSSSVPLPGAGGGLVFGEGGEGGASVGEPGADDGGASDGGAAGADQLAPGPAK